jgi:hypothetical protein
MQIEVSEIRRDVPVAGNKSGAYGDFREETAGRPKELLRYQVEQMKCGESIVCKNIASMEERKFFWRVNASARNAARTGGFKVTVRKTADNEITVWRVS